MSLARAQMIHRIKVERNKKSASTDFVRDGLGQFIPERETVYEALPSRVWDQESELVVTGDKVASIDQHKAIIPYKSDVQSKDFITQITDRRGTDLFGKVLWRVNTVHHFPRRCTVLALESANAS